MSEARHGLREALLRLFIGACDLASLDAAVHYLKSNDDAHARTHATIDALMQRITRMAADLTRLTADVAATQGFRASVLVLLQGLHDQIAALQAAAEAGDPELQGKIDALATSLEASIQPIVDGAVANPAPTDPPAEPGDPAPVLANGDTVPAV